MSVFLLSVWWSRTDFTVICLLSLWFMVMSQFMGEGGVFSWLTITDFSLSLMMLTIFLMVVLSFIGSNDHGKKVVAMCSCWIVCLFFLTDSVFWFFVSFEMSLIPLLLLVVCWGHQSERLMASFFLVLYTVVSSSPLLLKVVLLISDGKSSFSLFVFQDVGEEISVFSVFAFLTKVPVFSLHSWLPKAHVEAPLEGSVILAGVMLKLGVFGLFRFLTLGSLESSVVHSIFCLGLLGSLLSALISLSSDDVKMSVAYSSISHMNFLLSLLMVCSLSGVEGSMIISIAHGVSSPMLFYLVTKVYKKTHSRSILVGKGLFSKFPILAVLSFFLWAINLSAPPFFSFLGELIGIVSILCFWSLSLLMLATFVVLSSFFSVLNYSVTSHSSSKVHLKWAEADYLFVIIAVFVVFFMVILFLGKSW